MNQEQPRQYSAEEIKKMEEMKKRVVELGKNDAEGEDSIYDLAKKEDDFRSNPSSDAFSTEALEKMETGKKLEKTQKRLTETEEKSLTDHLTGLGNRRALKEITSAILKVEKRRLPGGIREKRNPVHSLIVLDLDFFKKINDTHGHPAGDRVLRGVAEAIRKAIREEGSAYRYGGEEFAVFLPHTNSEAAEKVAERIRGNIENLEIESSDGRKIKITASLGYSTTEQIPEETTGEELLNIMAANSDDAMYFSKGTGKNKIISFEKFMENKIVSDLWAESERNQVVRQLLEGDKSCQEIIGNIPDIKKAFKESAMSCGCSDGRIQEHRIGRPGQGILAGVEATVDYIGKMIEEGKIKDKFEITSHSGCGAAEMLYKILKEKGEVPSEVATHDDLGIKFTKDILKSAKKRFKNIEFTYRHIKGDEMEKIHNERAIYFDGTEKINIKEVSELPDGFTFTHMPEIDRRKTEEELEALCGIALGHHGFGERFTKEKPFWIIISAKDEEQLGELRGIAESVAKKFEGRVEVDGFMIKD